MIEFLLFVFGFCCGVFCQYLNTCFWKAYAKRKYSRDNNADERKTAPKENQNG